MTKLALCLIVNLAAACTKAESKLDKVTGEPMPSSSGVATSHTPSGDPGDRLARVERRLEKVIEILEQALPPAEPDKDKTYAAPISAIDPTEGPADAKVTIVEAFEFLCPYCYIVNPTLEQLRAKFPKDVRIVGKYMVIHGQPALPPAMIACAAAKQGKYNQVKEALWSTIFKMDNNRPSVQQDQLPIDNLKKVAVAAGLDAAKLDAELASGDCQKWLQDSQTSLRPLGVNATPSFFEEMVKAEIAKADKAIADGVAQADYYEKEIVGKGLKKVKGRFED
jgi:predicted DsbA family dithiol-disulfide isomerase